MAPLLLMLAVVGLTPGCTSDGPPPPLVDSDPPVVDTACADALDVTWKNWGKGFFLTYCDGCHSETAPDRHGAPDSVQFDTLSQVQDQADRVAVRTLDQLDMPPGGGVLDLDAEMLAIFLDCGL